MQLERLMPSFEGVRFLTTLHKLVHNTNLISTDRFLLTVSIKYLTGGAKPFTP